MGPAELEELLHREPFQLIRLVLASGDVILIENSLQGAVVGLTLVLEPGSGKRTGSSTRPRLVSIPNICFAERIESAPPSIARRSR